MKGIGMKRRIRQVLAVLIVVGMLLPMFRFETNAMSYSGSSSYESKLFNHFLNYGIIVLRQQVLVLKQMYV